MPAPRPAVTLLEAGHGRCTTARAQAIRALLVYGPWEIACLSHGCSRLLNAYRDGGRSWKQSQLSFIAPVLRCHSCENFDASASFLFVLVQTHNRLLQVLSEEVLCLLVFLAMLDTLG
jgi:hypothetical protein